MASYTYGGYIGGVGTLRTGQEPPTADIFDVVAGIQPSGGLCVEGRFFWFPGDPRTSEPVWPGSMASYTYGWYIGGVGDTQNRPDTTCSRYIWPFSWFKGRAHRRCQ